jgi:hypothetical protein
MPNSYRSYQQFVIAGFGRAETRENRISAIRAAAFLVGGRLSSLTVKKKLGYGDGKQVTEIRGT